MTIDEKIVRLRALVEAAGNAMAAGLIDDSADPELVELVQLVGDLDGAGIFGPQPGEPDPIRCMTVEMGKVPGLGNDCAVDIFYANQHNADVMVGLLIERGSEGASGETVARLPDYILNPKGVSDDH